MTERADGLLAARPPAQWHQAKAVPACARTTIRGHYSAVRFRL